MRESDDECITSGNVERHNSTAHCSDYSTPLHIDYNFSRKPLPNDELLHDAFEVQLEEKQFRCSEPGCGRGFSSKFKLMRHTLIHSGERQFKCTLCGRCFHRKDHLKNHLQVHNPNKLLHTCDKCNKQYTSSLSFRKHLAFHAAESGDLVCKLCGKICNSKDQIMHHLKVHSGSRALKGPNERKFNCDQCGRAFFTRKDVKRHLVVHTGIRNFVCDMCPQRFGRKDHLVRHIKKSHACSLQPSNEPNGNESQRPPMAHMKNGQSMQPHNHVLPICQGPSNHMVTQPCGSLASHPMQSEPPIVTSIKHPTPPPQMVAIKQHPVQMVAIKQECYPQDGAPIVTSSAPMPILHSEEHPPEGHYLRLPEIIPTLQPYPIAAPYPSAHLIPSNCYLSPMPPTISLSADSSLLPTSIAVTSAYSLDMGNPALPHFSQAFH